MSKFLFIKSNLTLNSIINGMNYWQYVHSNGYIQYFLDDFHDEIDGLEYFEETLTFGRNALYKAYSILPKELINSKGEPEVTFDFEDAEKFIETGEFPSVDKLNSNQRKSKEHLFVDTDNLDFG